MRFLRNMSTASLEDMRTRMEERKKKITSPPDGGSDFQKGKESDPQDGGSDFEKDTDKKPKDITSPPDGGSDFTKNNPTDDVGDSDLKKKSSTSKDKDKGDDGKKTPTEADDDDFEMDPDNVICDVTFISAPDDDSDDDDDSSGDDNNSDDDTADQETTAKGKKKKEGDEPATEGLVDSIKKFFSSKTKVDFPDTFEEADKFKAVADSIPTFVGPVGDEVARAKVTAVDPKTFSKTCDAIGKAADALESIGKQVAALNTKKKYDPKTAVTWGVKTINGIGSPYAQVFAVFDDKRKLYGFSRHNLKTPTPIENDAVGHIGWTENLLDKNVDELRKNITAFAEAFKKLDGIVAENDKTKKDQKFANDDMKNGYASMCGMITCAISATVYIAKESFGLCYETLDNLSKVFPVQNKQ